MRKTLITIRRELRRGTGANGATQTDRVTSKKTGGVRSPASAWGKRLVTKTSELGPAALSLTALSLVALSPVALSLAALCPASARGKCLYAGAEHPLPKKQKAKF